MNTQTHIHETIAWAKQRLDELDAGIAAAEKSLDEVNGDIRREADDALAADILSRLRLAFYAAAALAHELAPAKGMHPALDRLAAQLPIRVEEMASEMEARRLAQDVALAVQAALLAQTAPAAVFSAFCDSRIGGEWGHSFGSLGAGVDHDAILERAMPH